MIRDLAETTSPAQLDADVVIVGAGIAGLIAATRLATMGKHVLVLESGGIKQEGETHPLNETEQIGQNYKGSDSGRFRCLGGTSTRWGGALIPFSSGDFSFSPPAWDADWLGIDAELHPYLSKAEALFELPRSSYSAADVPTLTLDGQLAFVPRLAKWPAFTKRNVADLLKAEITSRNGPEIWLNTTVTNFEFLPDGRLGGVQARSLNGKSIAVRAPQFVLAAGAIECTRLLLLADRAASNKIFAPFDILGRYFHDHIANTVGQFFERVPRGLNRISGFRFEKGSMRNLRFEPTEELRRRLNLPAAFAHISFKSQGTSPFDGLRQILRAIQRREIPNSNTLGLLLGSSSWLLRAVWWRLAFGRLLYPDNSALGLDLVIEQEPKRSNRIDLSTQFDPLGIPLPRIDWRVSEEDSDSMTRLTEVFGHAWSQSPLADTATLELSDKTATSANLFQSGGVFHPGGSTRLGRSAREGVVDRDLRAFGLPNLTVVSTSVFPTGGGANPTMMLILASLRAADRIGSSIVR
jgi:hypothetical protein